MCSGRINEIEGESDLYEITELPIETWTRAYKNLLEKLIEEEKIVDIKEYHTQNRVNF